MEYSIKQIANNPIIINVCIQGGGGYRRLANVLNTYGDYYY